MLELELFLTWYQDQGLGTGSQDSGAFQGSKFKEGGTKPPWHNSWHAQHANYRANIKAHVILIIDGKYTYI